MWRCPIRILRWGFCKCWFCCHLLTFVIDSDDVLIVWQFSLFGSSEFCVLQLVSGFAEIFGTELVKNHPYSLPSGSKVAVFSWQGCTVNISFDYMLHTCIILRLWSLVCVLFSSIGDWKLLSVVLWTSCSNFTFFLLSAFILGVVART